MYNLFNFLFQLENRVDNVEDVKLVDTPLDIDPRTKNKKSEEDPPAAKDVKKNDKRNEEEHGMFLPNVRLSIFIKIYIKLSSSLYL